MTRRAPDAADITFPIKGHDVVTNRTQRLRRCKSGDASAHYTDLHFRLPQSDTSPVRQRWTAGPIAPAAIATATVVPDGSIRRTRCRTSRTGIAPRAGSLPTPAR